MTVYRLPGLTDVHVHLREPGGTHKEDFATGTAAALAGGITTVLAMPNTSPPLIDARSLNRARRLAAQKARCDVGLFVGAAQDNARAVARLAGRVAGLKVYVNATFGPLRTDDLPTLVAHCRAWSADRPIAVHAEGPAVAQLIGLSWLFGRHVHFCHVSRRAEIELIRTAKERGARISCEVSPHHLFLTEADAGRLGPFGQMRPSLGTEDDRAALWQNLDVIDCFATDHAPHTVEEKCGEKPPPGVPGLETMLPLLLTAVADGRLTCDQLVERTVTRPARIFDLPAQPDTWIEVEVGPGWTLPATGWQTKCGWSPFAGMTVRGRVRRTVLRGQVAFEDGQVRVPPGSGRVVFS
jgi:carbamoyl-phosphate synthase/aspartate carbamoyltransferase/dihydroorotase